MQFFLKMHWRAIFLTEIVGLSVEEVSFYLQLSQKTISRYDQFRTMRNASTAVIGSISIHPHEGFVIMESLLQYPEKTIAEMTEHVYSETESEYACSTLYRYLKRT